MGIEDEGGPITRDGSEEGTTLVRGPSNWLMRSSEDLGDSEDSITTTDGLARLRSIAELV